MKIHLIILIILSLQIVLAEESYNVEFTKATNIGDLIVKDYKPEDIIAKNLNLDIKGGLSTFTFKNEGYLKLIQTSLDKSGKIQKIPVIYDKLDPGSVITIDKEGNVIYANIKTKLKSTYYFKNLPAIELESSKDPSFIIYENGLTKITGNRFKIGDVKFLGVYGRSTVDIDPNKGFLLHSNTRALTKGVLFETGLIKEAYLVTNTFGKYENIKNEDTFLYLGDELRLSSIKQKYLKLTLYGKDKKDLLMVDGNPYLDITDGKTVDYLINSAKEITLKKNNLILMDVDISEVNGNSLINYDKKGNINVQTLGNTNTKNYVVLYGENRLADERLCKISLRSKTAKCTDYKKNIPLEFKEEDKYRIAIMDSNKICPQVYTSKTLTGKPTAKIGEYFSLLSNTKLLINAGFFSKSGEMEGLFVENCNSIKKNNKKDYTLLFDKKIDATRSNNLNEVKELPCNAVSGRRICEYGVCKKGYGYNKKEKKYKEDPRNVVGVNCVNSNKLIFAQTLPGEIELNEIGPYLTDKYGCEKVVNLDGGGSVSFVLNKEYTNTGKPIIIGQERNCVDIYSTNCQRPIASIISVEEC